MRPVSAWRSLRNQLPSLRQAGVLEWLSSLLVLPFPVWRLGSGGGSEDGSKAGSSDSGGEDILDEAELFFRDCCSMALSCPLVVALFVFSELEQLVVVSCGSWGSHSVFCLEAILLSLLRGLPFST